MTMLTENDHDLIAMAVDGALAPAEADRLRALLDHSREGRRLYQSLRREREIIQALTFHKAPARIEPAVMSIIAANRWQTTPSPSPNSPIQRRWLPAALAASVIIFAGVGAWFGMTAKKQQAAVQDQAQALPAVEDNAAVPPEEPRVVVSRIPAVEEWSVETAPAPREVAPPPQVAVANLPTAPYGSPFVPPPKFDSILVHLPMLAAMADLSRDDVKKQLAAELAHGPQAHLDLFCSDPLKAADLIVATGRAVGVNVMLDAVAHERLRRRVPTTWLIYTDSLTPDEATQWLVRLAAADNKGNESSAAPIFKSLHIPAATPQDQKDLKDLLGLEAAKPKPAKPAATKPIASGTIDQIASQMQKNKSAILVSFLPSAARVNPAYSKDVKAWLDRRGDRKPGTVALLIVVRSAN